jgi:hypothetical protein
MRIPILPFMAERVGKSQGWQRPSVPPTCVHCKCAAPVQQGTRLVQPGHGPADR